MFAAVIAARPRKKKAGFMIVEVTKGTLVDVCGMSNWLLVEEYR